MTRLYARRRFSLEIKANVRRKFERYYNLEIQKRPGLFKYVPIEYI
jgi:hypothetical protein